MTNHINRTNISLTNNTKTNLSEKMKKIYLPLVATIGLISTSCSQDEPMASLPEAQNNKINFSVTADNGSRAASAYQTGLDISKMTVSAWLLGDKDGVPNYKENNTNNATYFLNDLLTRSATSNKGVFAYASDARYWPANGETLDFFAVVDNEAWGKDGEFDFQLNDGPGLSKITQLDINKMPDLLYAYTPDQRRDLDKKPQQNVSFSFNHAFAKVIVTAEVKNKNLRIYITDMEICGITDGGQFIFPHKEDKDGKAVNVAAKWNVSGDFTSLSCNQGLFGNNNPVILDMSDEAKSTLVGRSGVAGLNNDLLVIPNSYSGRNSSVMQTYIKLKGYAYNISSADNGFNPEKDALIFPKKNADGTIVPADILIPIEFDWKMGTVNRYNIVFDCGNGGGNTPDLNDPAFIRIGYEVEVTDWTDGETKDPVEFDRQ